MSIRVDCGIRAMRFARHAGDGNVRGGRVGRALVMDYSKESGA